MPGTTFKVDCEPCVDMVAAGPQVATQGKRMLARVYKQVFTAIDAEAAKMVVWMPAHTPEDAVGVLRIGDGSFLTATDRYGNDEADRLAKSAVEELRVPRDVREAVREHTELQMHVATWLGQVTSVAGN